MERSLKQKVIYIGIPIFLVISIISIIYAVFTGQLNISGTAVGRQSSWDIHFENVSTITTTGTAKVLNSHQPVINSNNPTQIQDYEVSLTSPSDSISFTFDVVNDGNYNAKITSISVGTPECTSTDTTSAVNMCNNLTYTLKYSSGATINQNSDIVYARDKVTMKVTLTFNDINDASLLPTAGVSISNLGIQINFEQQGNALVNETTGEVANNRVYHQGDKITLNNEDYWVISNSGAGDDYVVALKDIPLTVAEVNLYGVGHISQYSPASVGTAYSVNGYGGIAYYTSETCGKVNNTDISNGCINDYDNSEIKYTVDSWALDTFQNNELREINSYKARLITKEEYQSITSYDWRYGNYKYFTMTPTSQNRVVHFIKSDGSIGDNTYAYFDGDYKGYAYYGFVYDGDVVVRPVINVYKSAVETNND